VSQLAEKGIATRVIGIPGAQKYEALMNALAVAGAAGLDAATQASEGYFDVADSQELLDALRTIAQGAATSCDIELNAVPAKTELVNVYVNNRLISENPDDGWKLEGKTIQLQGDSCLLLREGGARNVRVVVGCPTIIR
jgi:hypothetical protein